MNNIMMIDGVKAVIEYDPDIQMFRGEFVGLNQGGADFYATDVEGLRREGAASLGVFLDMCREDGAEPFAKPASGKLSLRLPPSLHQDASEAAKASGQSINAFIERAIRHELGQKD